MIFLLAVGVLVVGYLFLNGRRNSDPLNRKCAAELCEYLTSQGQIDVEEIQGIFLRNARYRKQANHVLSMVPVILVRAGYPRDMAMNCVPLLRMAIADIPK